MSEPKDGGSAFPNDGSHANNHPEGGMSLRDWFAGLAMQASFAGHGAQQLADRDDRYDETNWSEVVAANAYEMADAMLKARG